MENLLRHSPPKTCYGFTGPVLWSCRPDFLVFLRAVQGRNPAAKGSDHWSIRSPAGWLNGFRGPRKRFSSCVIAGGQTQKELGEMKFWLLKKLFSEIVWLSCFFGAKYYSAILWKSQIFFSSENSVMLTFIAMTFLIDVVSYLLCRRCFFRPNTDTHFYTPSLLVIAHCLLVRGRFISHTWKKKAPPDTHTFCP